MPPSSPSNSTRDTQPLAVGEPSAPEPAMPIKALELYTPPDPPPVQPPARGKRLRYWIGAAVAVLILAGVAASFLRERPAAPAPAGATAGQDILPALRPYYQRAQAGDVNAMRMLGTMYYNGLNVPQNTEEGIRWYRKAAAAGSVAAKKDLEQLGLGPEAAATP